MTQVRFLGDEHIPPALAEALWAKEPAIEFRFIGEEGFPPYESEDEVILRFAMQNRFLLVSRDRKTMKEHVKKMIDNGEQVAGVLLIKRSSKWPDLIDDLMAIWSASYLEEWLDRVEHLPWKEKQ